MTTVPQIQIGRLRAALVELAWRMVRFQLRYHAVQKRLAVLQKAPELPGRSARRPLSP
jgi:hypothetical protein